MAARQALQRQVGKGPVIVRPKSRAGRWVISLPGPLVAALRTHRAAQAQERLVAGSMWRNHLELVFTQANGHPVDPGQDYQQWRRLLSAAGVRRAMTQRVYAHVHQVELRELGAALRPGAVWRDQ